MERAPSYSQLLETSLAVRAYAISATLDPREILGDFDASVTQVKVSKTLTILRYANEGWCILHDFGAVVFVNVEEEERNRVLALLLKKVGVETRPPLEETYAIAITPQGAIKTGFNHVALPELDERSVELVALVVGQSVGMEYYEEDVDILVGGIVDISRRFAATGGFSGRSRELLKFIGRALVTRNQVVHTLSLLDAPPMVWESESLDRLYRQLRESFSIEDRYKSLEHKLRLIQDNLDLFVDLTRHRRSVALEVAVIVLIAAELLVVLLQIPRGH